jgi:hypothetical protein
VSSTDIEYGPQREREEGMQNTNCIGMDSRAPLLIVEPKQKVAYLFYFSNARGVAEITRRRKKKCPKRVP